MSDIIKDMLKVVEEKIKDEEREQRFRQMSEDVGLGSPPDIQVIAAALNDPAQKKELYKLMKGFAKKIVLLNFMDIMYQIQSDDLMSDTLPLIQVVIGEDSSAEEKKEAFDKLLDMLF